MRIFSKEKAIFTSLPKTLYILSLCTLTLFYGFFAYPAKWFPYSMIMNAMSYIIENINENSYYYFETDYTTTIPIYEEDSTYNGLSLVTSLVEDKRMSARIINMNGDLIHEWEIDWFNLWPNVEHVSKTDPYYPKSPPGTNIQGALLLRNGDLIFNFERLGLIRLDICGNVVWRLPYRTHHSIYLDEYDNLWVPGVISHEDPLPNFPNLQPLFYEDTILKISLDGEILKEISVFDILQMNGLEGLFYLSSFGDQIINVSTDPFHLNDVETFPSTMDEGIYKHGDIMISLRNINTLLIFREEDLKVTHIMTGMFVRQHDPDFIDGNTISVYDNYRIAPEDDNYDNQSRILIGSFTNGQYDIFYSGNEQQPFYSYIMGKHEWLPNGNLLITESTKGRAFEIDQDGNIVWEYVNLVGDEKAGLVSDVNRLPISITEEYLDQLIENCKANY
ncbi:MAG: arylsulfotransferase family protein [Candidatus Helarchaeota archaeon]